MAELRRLISVRAISGHRDMSAGVALSRSCDRAYRGAYADFVWIAFWTLFTTSGGITAML